MKILLFCNKGFETMEFAPFVDVFGWARNDFSIVQDSNIITSFCPETAADVAFQLLTCLVGEEKASAVIAAMGY